ncbi:MAG: response regulator [Anaerolineae bacterium]|nr:response regulator [Anaerolineae bacterium]
MKPTVILLIDDNRMDIELVLLAVAGLEVSYNIQTAHSGYEALDYLFGRAKFADRSQFPLPDIILLDLKMPGLDGQEVLRRIKTTPGLRRLPVIIFTSSQEDIDRANCYDSGANSYVVKPLLLEELQNIMQEIETYWLDLNIGPPKLL